jgi:hypothetical protein
MARKVSCAIFGTLLAVVILIPSAYAAPEYASLRSYPMMYTVAPSGYILYYFEGGAAEVECGTYGGTGELNSGPSTRLGFGSVHSSNCTWNYAGNAYTVKNNETCEYIFLTPMGTGYPYDAEVEVDGCFEMEEPSAKCVLVAKIHKTFPSTAATIHKRGANALLATMVLSTFDYSSSGCTALGVMNNPSHTDGEMTGMLEITSSMGIGI